jgi:hypothetical protein
LRGDVGEGEGLVDGQFRLVLGEAHLVFDAPGEGVVGGFDDVKEVN